MAKSSRALINPELLVWARSTSGVFPEDAAKKVGVSVDRLTAWEAGDDAPTVRQLRELARVYKRPFAAFYLPQPPTTFQVPHDFRTLRDGSLSEISPALRAEIRRIEYQRSLALELADVEARWRVDFLGPVSIDDEVEDVALRARQLIEVDIIQQTDWENEYQALNGWRAALERMGVLVFQFEGVEVDEVRGLSTRYENYPFIAVNGKDSPNARIFTLFHELAHLILDATGLCDMHESSRARSRNQRTERFCNSFAAAALLPAQALQDVLKFTSRRPRFDWSSDELQSAGNIFGVSREAVLRRLVTLEATSFDYYWEMRQRFQQEYEEAKQREKESRKKKGGGPQPPVMAVRRVGPTFARIVLNAYDREDITTSDLTEYLGVRTKHVDRVRELAFAGVEGSVG